MNDASEHEGLIHAVRIRLGELLQAHGLDPDQVYLNEVEDAIGLRVINSRSLVLEAVTWVERGEEPTFDPGLAGVFSTPHSFHPQHRVHSLRLSDFERMIRMLLDAPPGV